MTRELTVCQNCRARWPSQDLLPVQDIFQRVAPGEPMPSGECPDCGALCHPEPEKEGRKAQ